MRSIAPLPSTGNHARRIGWNPASLSRLAWQRPRATLPAMMLRQAQSSEPRPLPRFAPVRPGTASRANPALPLPYRPRTRGTPHRPSRNYRHYDRAASSGSVVANDPVNEEDPSGLCPSCVGAIIGAGLEIYDQVASGEASRTIANVGNALDRGDVLGAASAAGSSVGKIALSAGAGALGGGLAAGIERAVAGQVAKTVAVSAVGAVTNAGAQAGRNVADGRPVGSNLGRAAATGAIGAAGGRALGQAAQSRVFQNGVARINPGATAGSKGLATYDARQASRQAADRTANAVSAGVGAADSAQCRRTRCQ